MRASNEKRLKSLKIQRLSLLEKMDFQALKDVANATTEPLGEVTFRRKRLANKRKSHLLKNVGKWLGGSKMALKIKLEIKIGSPLMTPFT